jgi:oxygen-independent coproporphyrinogen-3 oxidase
MPEVEVELLDAGQAAREDAMLGLRLTRGIDDTLAGLAGVREILKTLETDGLVARAGGRWATTERGWLLGNEVFGRIWTGA